MIAVGLLLLALSGQPESASAAAQPAASQPASQPAAAHAAQASDDDKVICKTIPVTGSRFGAVDCMTKKDWAAQAAAAREFVNKSTTGACTGSVCH